MVFFLVFAKTHELGVKQFTSDDSLNALIG